MGMYFSRVTLITATVLTDLFLKAVASIFGRTITFAARFMAFIDQNTGFHASLEWCGINLV